MAVNRLGEYLRQDPQTVAMINRLRQQAAKANTGTHTGGLASFVNNLTADFMMGRERENTRATSTARVKGRKEKFKKIDAVAGDPGVTTEEALIDVPTSMDPLPEDKFAIDPIKEQRARIDFNSGPIQGQIRSLTAELERNPSNFSAQRALETVSNQLSNQNLLQMQQGILQDNKVLDRDELRRYKAGVATTKYGRDRETELEKRQLDLGDKRDLAHLNSRLRGGESVEKNARTQYGNFVKAMVKPYLDQAITPPPVPTFEQWAQSNGLSTGQPQTGQRQLQTKPNIIVQNSNANPTNDPMIKQLLAKEAIVKQKTPQERLAIAQANKGVAASQARETGKLLAGAKMDLPGVKQAATYMMRLLDDIVAPKMGANNQAGQPQFARDARGRLVPGKEHAGLQSMVGAKNVWSGALPAMLPFREDAYPGSDAADFQTLMKQVKGKQFLQAFETLKGGGQITEVEGTKATEAQARMSQAQSEKAFRAGVLEFREEVQKLVKLSHEKAQVEMTLGAGWTKVKP
tara:strand:- start:1290 stop:2843 length:1554 start_codon:yes stop_codon:yes gene_type:complete